MNQQASRQIILELAWWAFALILAALVLLPIYSARIDFPFYAYNAAAVILAVTVTRYIFTMHLNWMRDRFVVQGILTFLMIPAVFLIGQGLNEYITYLDNYGPDVLIRQLDLEEGRRMGAYLNSEFFFFSIWAVVAGIILPFRVIYRVWTRYRAVKK